MNYTPVSVCFSIFLGSVGSLLGDDPVIVSGRVVDSAGAPVAGVVVAPQWSANGLSWSEAAALRKSGRTEELWRNEGSMKPLGERSSTTDAEGRFSVELNPRPCRQI